ncbi:uncharacterized protein LOC135461889 [Liolophura sinensis]|uniref:uncharacterized protein LOC135461889 n=1 Tax=Liolophura sinensis TaxID=3198878 RepID=UPI00315874F9
MEKEAVGSILDFTGKGVTKIEYLPHVDPTTIIYDKNAISKLENLEQYKRVQELSVADSHIVRMNGLEKLRTLRMLNLPNNSIVSVEGLSNLTNLMWLNLSGNSIKVIENLSSNIHLQHLDFSDNCISSLSDLSFLGHLRTLLLHGNMISSVRTVPDFLPNSIVALSLAENELDNLAEISCLSSLIHLEQLSIMNNPMTAQPDFDYRPLAISCCETLKVLDGHIISEKERLKTEWLYSNRKQTASEKADTRPKSAQSNGISHVGLIEQLSDVKGRPATAPVSYNHSIHGNTFDSQQESVELAVVHGDSTGHVTGADVPARGKPRAAWSNQEGAVTLAISPQTGTGLQTASAEWTEDYESDQLESESVYLPVGSPHTPQLSSLATVIHPHSTTEHGAQEKVQPKPQRLTQHKAPPTTQSKAQHLTQHKAPPTTQSKAQHLTQHKAQHTTQSTIQHTAQPTSYSTSQPVKSREVLAIRKDSPGIKTGKVSPEQLLRIPSRPAPQAPSTSTVSKSRFESHETRAIKPLNQEIARGRTPAQSQHKMDLKIEPKAGNRKLLNTVPEVTKSEPKKKEVISQSVRSHALSHIKDVAESRKNLKKSSQQQQQQLVSENSLNIGKRLVREAWLGGGVRDSGFLSRPSSDAIDIDRLDQEKAAATKIQCVWRGYWARQHVPRVRWVREEMRRRRMEEHIVFLRAELDRQKLLYKEERELRHLQLEAIKHLWKEVQALQTWKANILSEQTSCNRHKHLNKEMENTMEKIEVISEQGYIREKTVTSPMPDETLATSKQQELEKTCAYLQGQVQQLHQTLQGFSHLVHSSHLLTQAFENPCRGSHESSVHVTGYTGSLEMLSTGSAHHNHWGLLCAPQAGIGEKDPTSLNHASPGCPTPPSQLQFHPHTPHSLVLSWQPSKIIGASQQEIEQPLLGYRIYVNEVPHGMVPGHQTSAVVDGLDRALTYRFHVRGISSIGESQKSNAVLVEAGPHKGTSSSSSSDEQSDETDDEHGSTGSLSEEPRRQTAEALSHQRTKRKSPHREKEVRRSLEEKAGADTSRKDSSSADEMTIFRYPRLHTPKRGGRNKSPESTLQSDPKLVSCDVSDLDKVISKSPETNLKSEDCRLKTADHRRLTASPNSLTSTDSSPKQNDDSTEWAQKPRRLRTKECGGGTVGDVPDSIVQVCVEDAPQGSEEAVTEAVESAHNKINIGSQKEVIKSPRSQERELPQETKKESSSSNSGKNSSGKSEGAVNNPGLVLSKPKPLLSTMRKPPASQTSPHSGSATQDGAMPARPSSGERRRMPVADMLERFANKQNSMQESGSSYRSSVSGSTATITLPKTKTAESLKLGALGDENELRKSKSENSSPTENSQPVMATVADSEPFSIKSRTQGSFVSKLLQKLQTFSKAQEQSIRQSQKSLKSRAKSSSDTALATGESEDIVSGRPRRISGGEDSEEEARAVLSDSAHCPPSSEKKKVNKGHKRSSSMHGAGPFVAKEAAALESGHSPIIMDGARKKTSPSAGSGSVRRHASFHGILPSKGQEIRQPSEDTSSGKIRTAPKPSPTESSGQPTFRSRSPSPNASTRSNVYQPVLSAAQLQRLKSPAGIGH